MTRAAPDVASSPDVRGVRVGHWTDQAARTGCTVLLFPEGTVASGEVRGGAPATREGALLIPTSTNQRVDAVLLTGGSAFGLGAADGVMRFCEERGMGFVTAAGPVPIVVAFGLYDLAEGDGTVRPGPDEGYAACEAASGSLATCPTGRVGAGTGATINKWHGPERARPGGIGTAVVADGDLVVGALAAVNAWGDIRPTGADAHDVAELRVPPSFRTAEASFANTTLGVVVTNARLTKASCWLVAGSGHDGMARALDPVHSTADGDTVVAAATGEVEVPIEAVRALAAAAVERAIRASVTSSPERGAG